MGTKSARDARTREGYPMWARRCPAVVERCDVDEAFKRRVLDSVSDTAAGQRRRRAIVAEAERWAAIRWEVLRGDAAALLAALGPRGERHAVVLRSASTMLAAQRACYRAQDDAELWRSGDRTTDARERVRAAGAAVAALVSWACRHDAGESSSTG